jgi:hypothetical protein
MSIAVAVDTRVSDVRLSRCRGVVLREWMQKLDEEMMAFAWPLCALPAASPCVAGGLGPGPDRRQALSPCAQRC